MSRRFLDQVWNNTDLTSTQKLVALSLADHADNDTGECYPSIDRIVKRCALSRRGVQIAIQQLVARGVITTNSNAGRKGSNLYRFLEQKCETKPMAGGACGAPPASIEGAHVVPNGAHVVPDGAHVVPNGAHVVPDGAHVVPNGAHDVRPNYQEPKITTNEPKTQSSDDLEFSLFLRNFPKLRNIKKSHELFLAAIEGGVDPAHIVSAAKAYAVEVKGREPKHIAGSDNWLSKGRWDELKAPASALATGAASNAADPADYWAGCINAGKFVPSSAISPSLAREMLGRQLVADDKLRGVGATW
jgi:hypothetical protein